VSSYLGIIDTTLRVYQLDASTEQRECIARTMAALAPDTRAAVEAAHRLIRFYGVPHWLAQFR
jgi:hypothetical protein